MTADQIVKFLQCLSAQQIKIKDNGWVEAACPLAPWLHQNHVDHNPSFGIKIDPGGRSGFSCFSCRSGSVEELLHTLEFYCVKGSEYGSVKYNFATAHLLLDEELAVMPRDYESMEASIKPFEEWPAYWLDLFKPWDGQVSSYDYVTKGRENPPNPEYLTKHKVRYDSKRQMLVFPYWNVFGKFAGARGRSILKQVDGAQKHFDYSFSGINNARLVWFNEECLNFDGAVVCVEGQFDCLRVEEAYPKVVANLTAKPSKEKFRKLADCPVVIQIPDNDATGQASVSYYASLCKDIGVRHKVLHLPDTVKDADLCHAGFLRDRIQELL